MKLTLKNIGPLREAEILLDGVTVLAGYNGTGKSTVSKALYGLCAGFYHIEEKIEVARYRNAWRILEEYIENASFEGNAEYALAKYFGDKGRETLQIFVRNTIQNKVVLPKTADDFYAVFPKGFTQLDKVAALRSFSDFSEKFSKAVSRPDRDYTDNVAGSFFRTVFDNQINTIDCTDEGMISLIIPGKTVFARFIDNRIQESSKEGIKESLPIYLYPVHLLDQIRQFDTMSPSKLQFVHLLPNHPRLISMQSTSDFYEVESETLTEEESRSYLKEKIDTLLHGKLMFQSGLVPVFDSGFSESVSIQNTASGNKTLAVLRRLIDNRALSRNSVLIIDEPETNLHPEWQLKMAEILVMLHKKMNVRVFLNTHSVYFLRAIEVYSREYDVEDRCHYYKTEPADESGKLFRTVCVDGETEQIYHDMYMPLKEIRNADTKAAAE